MGGKGTAQRVAVRCPFGAGASVGKVANRTQRYILTTTAIRRQGKKLDRSLKGRERS